MISPSVISDDRRRLSSLLVLLSSGCLVYILMFTSWSPRSIFESGGQTKYPHERRQIPDGVPRPPQPMSYSDAAFYADMIMEQRRRRATVDAACDAANMSRELDLGDHGKNIFKSVGHLLVDDMYKVLFGFIPKVSCTTWKGVMGAMRRSHRGVLNRVSSLRNMKDNLTEITYRLQNYRKVLFVREPITRMLSAYLSKLRNFRRGQMIWERFIGRKIVKEYRGYDHDELFQDSEIKPWMNITLSEYIQFITDTGSGIRMNELNDHWLPLHVISNPCQIQYDFIGHYENLAIEAPFLLQWLGIDSVVRFPEVHKSNAAQSLIEEYSNVPLKLIRKLYDYYGFDYSAFGYQINDTISTLLKGVFDDPDDDSDDLDVLYDDPDVFDDLDDAR